MDIVPPPAQQPVMALDNRPPKRLSRLLPAVHDPSSLSSSPSTAKSSATDHAFDGPVLDNSPLVPKRARIGVSIACDPCRTKKIRCDGGKPVCHSCQQRGILRCRYDKPPTKDQRAGFLVEAIGLLNSMTFSQANAALAALRPLERDLDIITTLRDSASESGQQSEDNTGTSSQFDRFLERMHSISYPKLEPVDIEEAEPHLEGLFTSRTKEKKKSGRENMAIQPSQAPGNDTRDMADTDLTSPATHQHTPDPALMALDINKWTTVPVSNDFASRAISLYITTDHPFLCPFDLNDFTDALVSFKPGPYCSSSLVNALLYWCCLAYTSVDPDSIRLVDLFRKEAEAMAERETISPSPLDLTTEMFLSFGYLMQGRNGASTEHLSNASNIGAELGLFGVPEDIAKAAFDRMTAEEIRAAAHPAWGVFNWTVLMRLFYRHEGTTYPKHPPVIPVPIDDNSVGEDEDDSAGSSNNGMTDLTDDNNPGGQDVFASVCHFWKIMHEVAIVYHGNKTASGGESLSLQFGEFKFRELLSWADRLPKVLTRSQNTPDVVVILHLYLHSAVLDIFRPFLQARGNPSSMLELRTFPALDSTPDAAYNASVRQLKQLVITSRLGHTSSNYTILWQTPLLYTGSAMLRSTDDDRLEHFLVCLYGLKGLRQCFRVTEASVQALLTIAMQQGDISSCLASNILEDLRSRALAGEEAATGGRSIRAPFMANLDMEVTDPKSATLEQVADQFEESLWINKYTNIFDAEA